MNETQNAETKEKNICSEANWVTNEQDLLFDLKCLIKEYYVATMSPPLRNREKTSNSHLKTANLS